MSETTKYTPPLARKPTLSVVPMKSGEVILSDTSTISSDEKLHLNLDPIDIAAEKKLLWKCDLHVLPMISLLYLLAFIDRINIGNARIQGLEKDLHMKGQDYNIALFVFFIPYIVFEIPSNLLLRKLAPSTWLSFLMFGWGMFPFLFMYYQLLLKLPIFRYHHNLHGGDSKLCWSCGMPVLPRAL